jgi:hypothetical protein
MNVATERLVQEGPYRFAIEPDGAMRVPGVVFASPDLLRTAGNAIDQVANVATLPGVVEASYAMPDVHLGYGFAIGGVAATDPAQGGVVSPGGVGFDISCGVRLMAADIDASDLEPVLEKLMDALDPVIPREQLPVRDARVAAHASIRRSAAASRSPPPASGSSCSRTRPPTSRRRCWPGRSSATPNSP